MKDQTSLGYTEWLALEIFKSYEDTMREAYINIRRNRLGGVPPLEFLYEEMVHYNDYFVTALTNLKYIVSDDVFLQVEAELERHIENLMDEVEGIV